MLKHIFFIGLLIGGSYYFWTTRPVTHGPGEVAPNKPEQQQAFGINPIEYKSYTIKPLAKYAMEARVLSKKRYYTDRNSEVMPYDFVVGWGPMSDERNLDHILIKQNDRYFTWEMTKPPIPLHKMEVHTANTHLIPSTGVIKEKMDQVRQGHVVSVQGYLVKVRADKGWSMKSSLTRNDFGKGSSEIIWVESFEIL